MKGEQHMEVEIWGWSNAKKKKKKPSEHSSRKAFGRQEEKKKAEMVGLVQDVGDASLWGSIPPMGMRSGRLEFSP